MSVAVRRIKSHLKYGAAKRKRRLALFFTVCILVCLVYIIFSGVGSALAVSIASAAEAKVSGRVNIIINETINSYLEDKKIDYGSLYVSDKNGAFGNTTEINSVKSEISEIIQDKINNMGVLRVEIPLGNITGSEFLMGRGPAIPFKFVTHGKVTSDFESDFSEAGINQTKHEVKIKISVIISMLLPSGAKECKVETSIPLADSITVGAVPEFYMSKGE